MTDEAFSEEDSEYPRLERFRARREMINTMIKMGAAPTPIQFETPRGAIRATKLKEMGRTHIDQAGDKFVQIGQQIDRPPSTGSISRLIGLTRKEPNSSDEEKFQVIGKPKFDYFSESDIPKLRRHDTLKKRTKK